MTTEPLFELAPLAALGALDGADKTAFDAESALSAALRSELVAFAGLVARIGLATDPIDPKADLRRRVLAVAASASPVALSTAAAQPSAAAAPRPRGRAWGTRLSLAAAVVVALAGLTWRAERDQARREAERARAEAESLVAQNRDLQKHLEATRRRLEVAEAFRSLVGQPTTRVVSLAGLPAAPAARGRVIWNGERREAVLMATGLPTPPAGKAYEAWVIAGGAPVPAGIFRVDDSGTAVHPLPRLEDTARAKTFAVTIEPEAGTAAPTGPMVLAGPAF